MTDYYEIHAGDYYNKTFSADPSIFLTPFVQLLSPGSRILDVGCGSGRDLLWLKQSGFEPTGLERSASLARLARSHSGCPVMEGSLETHDFSAESWNGVMMVGSLLHIPHERLLPTFQRILSGLLSPCLILLTLKEGVGSIHRGDGRIFHLWKDAALKEMFAGLNLEIKSFFRNASAIGSSEIWLGYVLMK